MIKAVVFLSLLCGAVQAQEIVVNELDGKVTEYTDAKGTKYAVQDVVLTSEFTLPKPVLLETKLLNKDEQAVVENALKKQGRILINNNLKPAKNDYKNDFDRGTVEYNPATRNYSFHKVIIPDGTIIRDSNFSQKDPHTAAIAGKDLTFVSCNLVNVELDPTWHVEDSNTAQIKRVKKSEEIQEDGTKKIIISHQVEKNGTFEEVAQDEEVTHDSDSYAHAVGRLND